MEARLCKDKINKFLELIFITEVILKVNVIFNTYIIFTEDLNIRPYEW
jgi:hypothetical protein